MCMSLVIECCSVAATYAAKVTFLHSPSGDVGQSAAGYDIKPQAAMEMLSTCDGRLQALMAEANLLGEAALSDGQVSSEDVELRQAFASTLIESGITTLQLSIHVVHAR